MYLTILHFMKKNIKQAEIEELLLAVKRYLAVNKRNVSFLYSFIAYKKDPDEEKSTLGACDCVDEEKSTLGAFGHLGELRSSIELLRDMVEDERDEDGHVGVIE